jgi:hypothetical protein
VKEVRGESGYTVKVWGLLAAWDTTKDQHPPSVFHIWKLVFLGEVLTLGDVLGIESDGVGFFNIDALPSLSLGRIFLKKSDGLTSCAAMVA